MVSDQLVGLRFLRPPHALSPLMRGDRAYWSKDRADRAVAAGLAEYLEPGQPLPAATEEPTQQLVEPAVEVLGCPDPVRQEMNRRFRKSKKR